MISALHRAVAVGANIRVDSPYYNVIIDVALGARRATLSYVLCVCVCLHSLCALCVQMQMYILVFDTKCRRNSARAIAIDKSRSAQRSAQHEAREKTRRMSAARARDDNSLITIAKPRSTMCA